MLKRGSGKWLGPYRVLDIAEKQVAPEISGKQTHFSIDKITLYNREIPSTHASEETPDLMDD